MPFRNLCCETDRRPDYPAKTCKQQQRAQRPQRPQQHAVVGSVRALFFFPLFFLPLLHPRGKPERMWAFLPLRNLYGFNWFEKYNSPDLRIAE